LYIDASQTIMHARRQKIVTSRKCLMTYREGQVANYALCARDIMQVEIATILGDASIGEAARLMLQEGVRSLLVNIQNKGRG